MLVTVFVPNDFLAAGGHDAASHPFLIQNTGVGRPGFHVGLVTANDPVGGVEDFAAILNARVAEDLGVAWHDLEGAA